MAKTFKLVNPKLPVSTCPTNWKLCLVCQEETGEPLTCPSKSKKKDVGSGYKTLAENLVRFHKLGQLPMRLERLDEGQGIEFTMITNNALYHHSCNQKYNNTKLKRAEKRALKRDGESLNIHAPCKRSRSQSIEPSLQKSLCFFCEQPPGDDGLHEAATFQIDKRVKECATILEDTNLLAKLSAAEDMVALDAKYHAKCLASLYNRARSAKSKQQSSASECEVASRIAFAELVMYIEEMRSSDEHCAPVFKLSDLAQLYVVRMEQLGVKLDERVHTTRLKERLLAQFTDMEAKKKGREIMLAFNEDIGTALTKACEYDSDGDAIHLARAAKIVRRHIFSKPKPFSGFQAGCNKESVPFLLLALVNMILEGPSIQDHSEAMSSAALTISQLLKFNSVKQKRKQTAAQSAIVRHSIDQETPVPIYVGLMVHAHTRQRDLVDRLYHLGMSISYDRVLRLSAQMGNTACKQFHQEHVVCPLKLRSKVFTSAAVDNIDHNPSSTTSKASFHGTGISLFQHPTMNGEGIDRTSLFTEGSCVSKTVDELPQFYTDIPPVNTSIKKYSLPATVLTCLKRDSLEQHLQKEYLWLDHTKQLLESDIEKLENLSWAAYHASHQPQESSVISPSSLLPLFLEHAHTAAMIKHSFCVVKSAIEHLNPGQTPVLTFDQPLYALAKQIQWTWPDDYGEDKFVVMLGGLHIEMSALKAVGDWLKGSGWVQALVQAEIATAGTAESFLHAAHVTRTRRAHQVTAAALYMLQHHAYSNYCQSCTRDGHPVIAFKEWCQQREQVCPQFQYWATVMELKLCILVYVRSLRQSSFQMYLDALTEIVIWFFALDHTNYARWLPVHLKDMTELSTMHPEVAKEFNNGKFTVQKTNRVFSAIATDHAHEQNNALIKGEGGAVGLTDNPSALRRWMVAGPEVARVIEEFHNQQYHCGGEVTIHHHDQTSSVQDAFAKDVHSLISVMKELGNPFEEDSTDLLALDTKEMSGHSSVDSVRNVRRIGQEQFQKFTEDRLIKRSSSLDEVIHRNNLKLFGCATEKKVSKGKHQLITLKNDVELFSRLFISCQTREGNLEEFFHYENQAFPPSLSDGGKLHFGVKSDLLTSLEAISPAQIEVPSASCVIVDGAAIVQMLHPRDSRNFSEYASSVFIPYMMSQLRNAMRLDVVWDRYVEDSLKGMTRAKRGKGVRRHVTAEGAIPKNWQNFLRVNHNKTELFLFLSKALLLAFDEEGKQLVITNDNSILSKPPLLDSDSLSPSTHEEADTRLLLHVYHAALHGHLKIVTRTVDTDVAVLAVSVAATLGPEHELWLSFGTKKHFRFLAAHKMAIALGIKKAHALPMFHALTGCDTVSSFVGHGKKTAWSIWNVQPELTDALLQLSCAPSEVPEDVMHIIERFVILLYDRTSQCTDIDKARKKMFTKKPNVKQIPPTKAALEQHVRRATYQGGHVWGQSLLPAPVLPSPTIWGWIKTDDGLYEPNWTTLPEASKACCELVACKCKKGCVKRCKCKKAALQCTALCACEGECIHN